MTMTVKELKETTKKHGNGIAWDRVNGKTVEPINPDTKVVVTTEGEIYGEPDAKGFMTFLGWLQ